MTAQTARAKQAKAIVTNWERKFWAPEQILEQLNIVTRDPKLIHLAAHLVTECRERRLVPGLWA